jgi:hypothetical protein
MSFVAPILLARSMDISNRYLSNDDFNHSPLSRAILHLPILSMPAGSRRYAVTIFEQMPV